MTRSRSAKTCRLATRAMLMCIAGAGLRADAASQDDGSQRVWLAVADGQTVSGRLIVSAETLTFLGAGTEWSTPLADITRVSVPAGAKHVLRIDTVTGASLRVSILDTRMLAQPPAKALQLIQRAVREAPPARRTTLAAAGNGSSR